MGRVLYPTGLGVWGLGHLLVSANAREGKGRAEGGKQSSLDGGKWCIYPSYPLSEAGGRRWQVCRLLSWGEASHGRQAVTRVAGRVCVFLVHHFRSALNPSPQGGPVCPSKEPPHYRLPRYKPLWP